MSKKKRRYVFLDVVDKNISHLPPSLYLCYVEDVVLKDGGLTVLVKLLDVVPKEEVNKDGN